MHVQYVIKSRHSFLIDMMRCVACIVTIGLLSPVAIRTAHFVRTDRILHQKHYFIKENAAEWKKNTEEKIINIKIVGQKDIKYRKKNTRL